MFRLNRRLARVSLALLVGTFAAGATVAWGASEKSSPIDQDVSQGALRMILKDGGVVECPLKHTDVKAEISGFIARVRVQQTFRNPTKEKIEAVYVFPLPHEAAVDEMTMLIGERKIVGLVKRRQEARAIYEQALAAGQTAALLEQERPNIFTQSVGNIGPEQEVKIEISYVDVLRYDMGTYAFHFPMVVGPRYIPGTPSGSSQPQPPELQGKVSPPVAGTDRVPDAQRISPPVLKPGYRTGHDISLRVSLDAGVPIQDLKVANHQAEVARDGQSKAKIELAKGDSLPNKDFVLRYEVAGQKPAMAVLAHTGNYTDTRRLGKGYFMLMIQPAEDERLTKSPPREMVFLVDVSGSMSGEPTAKVIEAMQGMLKLCRPQDSVQVITFASHAQKLFEKPLPVVPENIQKALNFTAGLQGAGGTEMLKGVKMAIDEPLDPKRMRIVVMLTDGYIGNEAEIIEHVGKNCGDQIRFWCIGIGSSPNMFLVDGVARQGGGMGKQLGLKDETLPLTQEIMSRIQRAQLAKIAIDWGDLSVAETYPAKIPELWAGRPVIVFGRYSGGRAMADGAWQSQITVRGLVEGEPVSWPITVRLPAEEPKHDVLAKTWARQKIEDLMQQDYYGGSPAVEEAVTALALDYRLMSQYTSFVAVDAKEAQNPTEPARPPRRMLVPVPLPAGTKWEGFFGELRELEDHAERLSAVSKRLKTDALNFGRALPAARTAGGMQSYYALGAALPRQQNAIPSTEALHWTAAGKNPSDRRSYRARAFGPTPRLNPANPIGRGIATGAGFGGGLGGGGFGGPAPAPAVSAAIEGHDRSGGGRSIPDRGAEALQEAEKTWQELEKLADSNQRDLSQRRRLLERVYFLDSVAATEGHSVGTLAANALAQLNELHEQEVREWVQAMPALDKRLDLVLKDKSLEEALAAIAGQAGTSIRLLAVSTQDAAELLDEEPRVTYLDLRGATLAQALDWTLQPARMTWRPADNGIVAGTSRRMDGVCAWVYDVSEMVTPLDEELPKDDGKAIDAAERARAQFLLAARAAVRGDSDDAVWLYGPGQLLVFGNADQHARIASLLTSLRQDGPKQRGSLAEAVSKRLAARKAMLEQRREARHQLAAMEVHETFAWRLLCAAAAGRVDDEALAELQIAWRSPATMSLLKNNNAALTMLRSAWAILESARSMPANEELADLADDVKTKTLALGQRLLTVPANVLTNEQLQSGLLYAAMMNRENASFCDNVLNRLAVPANGSALAVAIARVLLDRSEPDTGKQLLQLAESAVGADQTMLLALACRRCGGGVWKDFRASAAGILNRQPIPGEVVVLVHELSHPLLQIAQAP